MTNNRHTNNSLVKEIHNLIANIIVENEDLGIVLTDLSEISMESRYSQYFTRALAKVGFSQMG